MSELSKQDVERLQRSLDSLTKAINETGKPKNNSARTKSSRPSSNSKPAENTNAAKKGNAYVPEKELANINRTLEKSDKAYKDATNTVSDLASTGKSLVTGFTSLAGVAGTLLFLGGKLVSSMSENLTNYRSMITIGQDFGGSMLTMKKAAAEAAMPLNDFTKLMVKNSTAIAVIGTESVTSLSKSIRTSLKDFSMLGYTADELNEIMTMQMETQTRQGALNTFSTQRSAKALTELATESTRLAELTGKSRMEIMAQTQAALQNQSVMSMQALLSGAAAETFGDNAQKMATYFAAIPGEAGSALQKGMLDIMGKGVAGLSAYATKASEAGVGGVTGIIEQLSSRAKKGLLSMDDMEIARQDILKVLESNEIALKTASDAGNESATEFQSLLYSLRNMSEKDLKDLRSSFSGATKFSLTFEENLRTFTGRIRETYYEIVEKLAEAFSKSGAFGRMEELSGKIVAGLKGYADKLAEWMTEDNIESLFKGIEKVGSVIGSVIGVLGTMIDKFGLLGTAVGVIAGAKGIGLLFSAVKNFASNVIGRMTGGAFTVGHGSNLNRVRVTPTGAMLVQVQGMGDMIGGNGRKGTGKGTGKGAGKGTGRMGGAMRGGLKFGTGALLTAGAGMALDHVGDFKGKQAVDSGLNIASGAMTGAMIGSIVPVIGTAVGAAVGGLATAAFELYENIDSVQDFFTNVTTDVTGMISNSIDFVGNVASSTKEIAVGIFDSGVSLMSDIGETVANKAKDIAVGVFDTGVDLMTNIGSTVATTALSSFNKSIDAIATIGQGVSNVASSLFDTSVNTFSAITTGAMTSIDSVLGGLGTSLSSVTSAVGGWFGGLVSNPTNIVTPTTNNTIVTPTQPASNIEAELQQLNNNIVKNKEVNDEIKNVLVHAVELLTAMLVDNNNNSQEQITELRNLTKKVTMLVDNSI